MTSVQEEEAIVEQRTGSNVCIPALLRFVNQSTGDAGGFPQLPLACMGRYEVELG